LRTAARSANLARKWNQAGPRQAKQTSLQQIGGGIGAVWTSFGDFEVVGDELIAARIKELDALHALDETSAP